MTRKRTVGSAFIQVQAGGCMGEGAGNTASFGPCRVPEFTPYADSRRHHVTPLSAKNSASLTIAI